MALIKVEQVVTVCDKCLCASCWQGEFYCQDFVGAGTVEKTVSELEDLGLEDSSYWNLEDLRNVKLGI